MHLAGAFLPDLEDLLAQIIFDTEGKVHSRARIFLTADAACDFLPPQLLQNAIKVSLEPPQSVRTLAVHTIREFANVSTVPSPTILLSLALLHAAAHLRGKYGPLGWNQPYHFADSDFEASLRHLAEAALPHTRSDSAATQFLLAQVNYGGRVIDENDRLVISALTESFLT